MLTAAAMATAALCAYGAPIAFAAQSAAQDKVEAAYKAELAAAPDPAAHLAAIEARLNKVRSPFRTAERFGVEEIIDPRDTRRLLCEFANLAAPMRKPGPRSFGFRP